jgi:FkbM family methyltransferase
MMAYSLFAPLGTLRALFEASLTERVTLAGMHAYIPGPLPIRLSVVLSNLRMQRMLANNLHPGDTVVDVGANIGYNTLYAARCVGAKGRVYAIEPAQDNLTILYANLFVNDLRNVVVLPYAAGKEHEVKRFYLRGDVSAVNSLFQDNFYHSITQTVEVLAAPLDELIPGAPTLVKIDVEGGELEVLQGMSRLLANRSLRLIVEWHPTLQKSAGHPPEALPRYLMELGYTIQVVTHTHFAPLNSFDLPTLCAKLLDSRSPVELFAFR